MSVKDGALTTAQRAADWAELGTLSGSELTKMERLIDNLSTIIENYLGFTVKKTAYVREEYDTEEGNSILLQNQPVVEGETFTLERRTSSVNEDNWETVDGQYYHVDYDDGIVYSASGYRFARTRRGYRASYTAGYDFDNSTTFLSDTKGAGIEQAIWTLAEILWSKRKGGAGIQSESIGDYKIVYKKALFKNPEIKDLLDEYRTIDEDSLLTPWQA